MDWLLRNWQTIAALGIVALTLALFTARLARAKRQPGCGEGCDCPGRRVARGEDR